MSALHQKDGYKIGHPFQYPEGTEEIYSNFTARAGWHANIPNSKGITFVGLQYFIIDYLINEWNDTFFDQPKEKVIAKYQRRVSHYLGYSIDVSHIEALHDLGFLPLEIKALPEGSFIPYNVPMLTVRSTHGFGWCSNLIESVMSSELFQPITTATTYMAYKRLFVDYAKRTGAPLEFVPYQGHDFSFRGMPGRHAAAISGFAALACGAIGTDTLPAIDIAEDFYGANVETEIVGQGVAATEHSVMCAGGKDTELDTIRRLLVDVYPSGPVSIVWDTWDFWKSVTENLPILKQLIMARDGKLIIRPDSGDPVKILIGDSSAPVDTPEYKGLIQCLWDIFGGTVTTKGHKVLDSHIGAIYGDSITYDRAEQILHGLYLKGFASNNIVLGIGSFTYQYITRDTHGMAFKSTHAIIRGEYFPIFKEPKTDGGTKVSAKGYLMVSKEQGMYKLWNNATPKQEKHGCLETVFKDGQLTKFQNLSAIRKLTEII
jgi:nicotinamide phosphoribosyltransferase